MKKFTLAAAVLGAVALGATGAHAQSRDQIRIVGSSTVFPFSTAVAEEFGRTTSFKTPIVESTGTGGGLKLFCAGVGTGHPDITNASRRIKKSEVDQCTQNGVNGIIEVKIGFDGIVVAASKDAEPMTLTLRDLYLALAAKVPAPGTDGGEANLIDNPYTTWAEVNPDLPNRKIEVLGPPPTSGTRDAFDELAIEGGCVTFSGNKAMAKSNSKLFKAACHGLREDGAYIEAGENDNLIVQKLQANTNAIGVFGFSFLDQNADVIQGFPISHDDMAAVEPTFDDIASGAYPISRSLYFYVKKAHIGVVPGIREFLSEFTSDKAWGDLGYLADRGLIPLPEDERAKVEADAANLNELKLD
ncbi:MAG: PstS family phosphate ABC transporter substrate-binding protein [Alphaproteobacteria bacterium]|nr:MAG: PstS family phosphate ABC transporter substrate-binding protein [Alphaproteobacteria bacterium]